MNGYPEKQDEEPVMGEHRIAREAGGTARDKVIGSDIKGLIMTAQSKLNPGFADRLITVLTQAGIRPKDLASRIDVPLEVVEACIKGKVPEAEVLYRIAKGLDVTMEWLLTGEEVRLPKETIH